MLNSQVIFVLLFEIASLRPSNDGIDPSLRPG
jgi:hypothetical protein